MASKRLPRTRWFTSLWIWIQPFVISSCINRKDVFKKLFNCQMRFCESSFLYWRKNYYESEHPKTWIAWLTYTKPLIPPSLFILLTYADTHCVIVGFIHDFDEARSQQAPFPGIGTVTPCAPPFSEWLNLSWPSNTDNRLMGSACPHAPPLPNISYYVYVAENQVTDGKLGGLIIIGRTETAGKKRRVLWRRRRRRLSSRQRCRWWWHSFTFRDVESASSCIRADISTAAWRARSKVNLVQTHPHTHIWLQNSSSGSGVEAGGAEHLVSAHSKATVCGGARLATGSFGTSLF